uniref:Protein ENL n=1 Tax=Aceria tosichella TaxID=561515 RepID=A0A6G1SL18_9ACAR
MGGKKVFELMLEIGHTSQPLKSKLPNGYTHKWTVFVRGANDSKIEHCVQRVVFQLHDSFPVPNREVTAPPYQVKETGYAGFEIPIQVYFKSKDKLNHVVFMLDLCLLTNKPHSLIRLEKVKFNNPPKEFEKLLLKSGAQLISITKDKKERSHSPPAKRQKSSSLIPSKDMCKQSIQSSQNNNNRSQSPASQSGGSSSNSLFGNHISHQNNHHSIHDNNRHSIHDNNRHQTSTKPSSQQQASSLPKTKSSSREFIDVFGAPLVYNNSKSHRSNGCKDNSDNHKEVTFTVSERSPLPPITHQKSPQLPVSQSNNSQSHHHKSSNHHSHHHRHHTHQSHKHNHTKHQAETQLTPQQAPQKVPKKEPQPPPPSQPQQQQPPPPQQQPPPPQPQAFITHSDPFTTIQNKIASLTDCDRLQKIVDIIEESGEWFNLTPNKFEFDLKRLDRKTLSRIEKCLQL